MVTTPRDVALLEDARFGELLQVAQGLDDPEPFWELWRARLRHRLPDFCRYCWPGDEDKPGLFDLPFNEMHDSLFDVGDVPPWQERRGTPNVKNAIAAPRGYAKTTIASFAQVVHDIVYGLEKFIVLISAGQDLSLDLSRDLMAEFGPEGSERLRKLYGPFKLQGSVERGWRVSVKGRPWVDVLPRSFGTRMRGIKRRGVRPTKVLIDDGEDADRVRNPEQRRIWWNKLTKDILKLGARNGGTVITVVGTVLHPDSMLANLMADPGWESQRWKAIIEWPDNMGLWDQCGEIWKNLTLGEHRQSAARAVYEGNREAMDKGAVLLDPGSRSLFDLFEIIWGEGLPAFLQEMQNNPVDPSTQIFVSDKFVRFSVERGEGGLILRVRSAVPRTVHVKDLRLTLRWDPAMGSPDGDFPAIAVVGRDKYGYKYVLDVWMEHQVPDLQLEAAWTLAERWGVSRGTFEDDGFQELVATAYARQRKARKASGRFWRFQLIGRGHGGRNKNNRIAAMQPDTANGFLAFNDSISYAVYEQFDQHPTATNDDGADAVQGAWEDLGGSPVGMRA